MHALLPSRASAPAGASAPIRIVARHQMIAIALSAAAVFGAPESGFGQVLADDPLDAQVMAIDPVLARGAADDPVIARVDSVDIRQSDLALAEESLAKGLLGLDERAKRESLIKYLSDMIIMSKVAQKQNLADSTDLQRLERRIAFNRNKMLMDKLLQTTARTAVTDEAVRKAYDEAVQKAGTETEIHLRGILFGFKDVKDDAAVNGAEARAKAAIKRIAAGEDFVAVAKDVTESPSGKQNGADLGYMTRSQMGQEFAEVAFKLDNGGVSQPVKTNFGWHVLKVEDKRPRKPADFEVVRDRYAALVARRAQLQLISNLRAGAKIELIDKLNPDDKPAEVAK